MIIIFMAFLFKTVIILNYENRQSIENYVNFISFWLSKKYLVNLSPSKGPGSFKAPVIFYYCYYIF